MTATLGIEKRITTYASGRRQIRYVLAMYLPEGAGWVIPRRKTLEIYDTLAEAEKGLAVQNDKLAISNTYERIK